MNWDVETANLPPCHRCSGGLYLMLRIPFVDGGNRYVRLVPLCPRCDAGDPNSQALLAFFAYHSQADVGAAEDLAALAEEWARGLPPQPTGVDVLDEDAEAYYRGDMDI